MPTGAIQPFFFFFLPGMEKNFFYVLAFPSELSEASPFLKRRNINTSIRKLTFLSLFENYLLLRILSQWSEASQNLKAHNIWPRCHQNNCQQGNTYSFIVTLLISSSVSARNTNKWQERVKIQEKCTSIKHHLKTRAL